MKKPNGTIYSNSSKIHQYLKFIFFQPLTIWWAAFIIMVELIAFLLITPSITINRIWILLILFFVSFSIFIGIIVIYRGWMIFYNSFEKIFVSQIVRIENEQIFLLDSPRECKVGTLLEIFRIMESIEVPIGLLEVTHVKSDGVIQAIPRWILPIHLKEIETHELSVDNLVIYSFFTSNILIRWVDEQAERKITELMKKGS